MVRASLILPVHNGGAFIDAALWSARRQTIRDLEIIVVDDGSTDDTPTRVERHASADARIRVIRRWERGGQARALNRALAAIRGDYVSFVDADDELERDRTEACLERLLAFPEEDVVVHPMAMMDEAGNLTGQRLSPPDGYFANGSGCRLFERSYLSRIQGVFRASALDGLRFDENLSQSQDYQLYLHLVLKRRRFHFMDRALYRYRIHDENISHREVHARHAEATILAGLRLEEVARCYREAGFAPSQGTLAMGLVCLRRGDLDAARELFLDTLRLRYERCAESLFYLARIAWIRGEVDEAGQRLAAARAQDSQEPTCANNLGVVLASEGDWGSAAQLFQEALELQPGYRDAAANLALFGHGSEARSDTSRLRFTPARLKASCLFPYGGLKPREPATPRISASVRAPVTPSPFEELR